MIEQTEEVHYLQKMVECENCGWRWIAVYPQGTIIHDLECPECGAQMARPAEYDA